MAQPTIFDRLLESVSPGCEVPEDLDSVTDIGEEVPAEEVGLAARVPQEIWARVEDLYRTGMHPAIGLCVRRHGAVLLDRSIGHARGNEPRSSGGAAAATGLTTRTPINLFSAAKPVTAMLMHKLEEQGVLHLDDRVCDHIPEFARHGKERITLRHVLTHRAGIPELPEQAFDLDHLADPEAVLEILCDLVHSGPPGGPPAYHAISGGFVLAEVARRASGRDPRELLDSEIKQPLGVRWLDFGVDEAHVDEVALNASTGVLPPPVAAHLARVVGAEYEHVIELSNDPRFLRALVPSGNCISTAHDIAVFYQCLLDEGEWQGRRVFEARTVRRAIRPDEDSLRFDRMLMLPMRYGTGFMLGNRGLSLYGWNHPRAFGHLGLSNSFTWANPERDLVVALLTTGKPVLGTHVLALPRLIGAIHSALPRTRQRSG